MLDLQYFLLENANTMFVSTDFPSFSLHGENGQALLLHK